MVDYSLGFIFDKDLKNVMLVEKQRPKWQKLKLNGLGGHVELNETFVQCMARELQEEAAVALNESEFRCYAIMKGEDWTIGVFWAILDPMYFLTLTDEKVGVYSVDEVLDGTLNAVDNLPFLISKALQEAGREDIGDYSTENIDTKHGYSIILNDGRGYIIKGKE